MPVPYPNFASATTSIPLSQLDNNFATTITLGNVAVQLGNTVTTIGNVTLTNTTISGLSGGSANGVVYINSSNVAVASPAVLAFDGTNLGVGGTPSAWGGGYKAIDISSYASVYGNSNQAGLTGNCYNTGTNWIYKTTSTAGLYAYVPGGFVWYNAPSGNASSAITFTQTMTLDISGVLTVTNGVKPYQLIGSSIANNISWDGAQFYPQSDNTNSNGYPGKRWTVIYATTGTINTSDANQKQDIAELDDAEKRVAVAVKSLIKKYRFKDAVAEKGEAARIHVGAVAQEVQAAFVAEGLDPSHYALFCSNTWYEVDGKISDDLVNASYTAETEGAIEVTQLGLRYDELLAFVIAAI